MGHPKVETFAAWLLQRGLRATPQRLRVAEVLLSADDHPSTEERFANGVTRFEEHGEEHHDHILCLDCGRMIEVIDPALEARQVEVARRLGFRIVDHVHEMEARCDDPKCPHRPAPNGGSRRP